MRITRNSITDGWTKAVYPDEVVCGLLAKQDTLGWAAVAGLLVGISAMACDNGEALWGALFGFVGCLFAALALGERYQHWTF